MTDTPKLTADELERLLERKAPTGPTLQDMLADPAVDALVRSAAADWYIEQGRVPTKAEAMRVTLRAVLRHLDEQTAP